MHALDTCCSYQITGSIPERCFPPKMKQSHLTWFVGAVRSCQEVLLQQLWKGDWRRAWSWPALPGSSTSQFLAPCLTLMLPFQKFLYKLHAASALLHDADAVHLLLSQCSPWSSPPVFVSTCTKETIPKFLRALSLQQANSLTATSTLISVKYHCFQHRKSGN